MIIEINTIDKTLLIKDKVSVEVLLQFLENLKDYKDYSIINESNLDKDLKMDVETYTRFKDFNSSIFIKDPARIPVSSKTSIKRYEEVPYTKTTVDNIGTDYFTISLLTGLSIE